MSTPTTSQHSLSCGAYTPGEGGVIVTDGELTVGDTTIAEFWQDAEGGDVRRAQPTGGAWRRHGRGILPRPTRRGRERTDVRESLVSGPGQERQLFDLYNFAEYGITMA